MSQLTYDQLRKIRNNIDISAKEMANLLGLKTEAAYYKKESGTIKFSLVEARIISDKFKMSIEEIFFNDMVSNKDTNNVKKFLHSK